MPADSQLIELIRQKALEFGDFTLASGQRANFYLDCRKLTLDAEASVVVADAMLRELESQWPDAVGGMAVGAVPLATAILTRAGGQRRQLRGFFVRKEPKAHGKGQQVEGPVQPGESVVIVEDVVTSGGSSVLAIQACHDFGLHVLRVLAIVDRQAGGEQKFREMGIPFTALVCLDDLGIPRRPA